MTAPDLVCNAQAFSKLRQNINWLHTTVVYPRTTTCLTVWTHAETSLLLPNSTVAVNLRGHHYHAPYYAHCSVFVTFDGNRISPRRKLASNGAGRTDALQSSKNTT